jgi:hypothetical protein
VWLLVFTCYKHGAYVASDILVCLDSGRPLYGSSHSAVARGGGGGGELL